MGCECEVLTVSDRNRTRETINAQAQAHEEDLDGPARAQPEEEEEEHGKGRESEASRSQRSQLLGINPKVMTDLLHLCKRRFGQLQNRNFSSFSRKDEISLEEEANRKIGWFLKLLFAGTATAVAYQFFPYLGDNLMQQSVSLLRVKDPLFKRMGASRLARFAIDGISLHHRYNSNCFF
ncbi:hypothetical protein SAY86_024243 [Trapa natans]|uniref:Uncharacterized protein n=1 Tax=Trapa natans TaxID=22666 RepID=A0AAN7MTW9_TRANT|nr:hypothetical protein SAY86_024243 [Trapa natans]